ncbi:Catechol 2,3-dioxygenase [Lishizhenia tianjinensis]|uniref:Catechol 2,3-dioxygenase n=1 Tax=Lishizhenia tianjinensis TaxID=477690 RepID=A0A1I7BU59_9FLAO|nr:VOC family protein [Lishizhenia tianjinensis]SFT90679.1 Catechol 2,3-dioxygenase [Lishizhenia tianjinensis]
MKTLEASRVNLMVMDMDKSIVFYTETLGFQLLNRWGNHYAEIQAVDLTIALHENTKNHQIGTASSIGFGVSAFDDEVEALKTKGITLSLEDDAYIRLAHFTDPDGHPLFLAERK